MFIIPFPVIQVAVVLINALSVWLVFLVNSKKLNTKLANLFTMMIALMLVWVNFAFLARATPPEQGIVFIRLAWSITPLFFALIYLFVEHLFNPNKKISTPEKIFVSLGLLNIPFIFLTHLVIDKIWFTGQGVIHIEYGNLEWIFFWQVLIASFLIIRSLVKRLKTEKKELEKAKIRYLLIGFSFFLIVNGIFNIILPVFFQRFNLYAFGDYSTIVFLSFIAYAITKKNLFGVKVVLSTMAIGLIAILLLIDMVIFTADILWIRVMKGLVFVSFLGFGTLLVKSVVREIERREELEKLSDELVEMNIKLKEANKKLEKLDKAKSEFISIASHQLRTPLTAIKGYLSMIEDGSYGDISDSVRSKLGDVLDSSERLIALVNDLLSVSRIESGKIEMEFEKVEIGSFLEGMIDELRIAAESKGLYLKMEKEIHEKLLVDFDEGRMRQVILNLIDNAIKYTKEGGVTITLKKQEMKSGKDSALVSVSDTGEGMTKKDIDNMFQSFSRGSAGDLMHAEGAGLGLYIAKKFVDMHNGSIWIESEGKGKGTTFFIELPLQQ